jgi:uncharacterized protein YcfJ
MQPESSGSGSTAGSGTQMSKTGMGVATGAAIGAVTGLAIGSTSGNAGEGFLVGTTIGAAAGAGIGSALEGQEEKLATHREEVNRQEQRIQQQGEEIQKLRKTVIDGQFPISKFNAPSIGHATQDYSGSPSAKVYGNGSRGRMAANSGIKQPLNVRETSLTSTAVRPKNTASRMQGSTVAGARRLEPPAMPTTTAARMATPPTTMTKPLISPSATPPEAQFANSTPELTGTAVKTALPSTERAVSTLPPATGALAAAATTSAATGLPPAATAIDEASDETAGLEAEKTAMAAKLDKAKMSKEKVAMSGAATEKAKTKMASAEKSVAEKTETKSPTAPAATTSVVETKPEMKTAEMPTEVAKATTEPQGSTPVKDDGGCAQADSEATRGREATSDADKLFYFRRAIRLCPTAANYYVEVGKVYVTIGRTEDAQHEFNKALELDPENEAAQNELSMIMLGAAY